jgi:hypothetical protein
MERQSKRLEEYSEANVALASDLCGEEVQALISGLPDGVLHVASGMVGILGLVPAKHDGLAMYQG